MDYMNFNELDLEQMFTELNETVADLSFEKNDEKCTALYNEYYDKAREIKDLIIGKVRDLDEARERAKELLEKINESETDTITKTIDLPF